mgnify:CR=1 FL=1
MKLKFKGDYTTKGGLIGLGVILIISILVRLNVFSQKAAEIFYFPLDIGFYLYTGLNILFTRFPEIVAVFLMFLCLVLFYHLTGSFIGWLFDIRRKKK